MVKNHLKTITAPRQWNVLRKDNVYITRPNPGAHSLEFALSVDTFLKTVLNVTKTKKESKFMLTHQGVKVNGKPKRDVNHQVGFLDIVSLPGDKTHYLCTINNKGLLSHKEVSKLETIVKVRSKSLQKKGKVQLNTLNGINLLLDPKTASKYKVGDSLLISLPDHKVLEHIPRAKGNTVFVYTGKHAGKKGTIEEIKDKIITIKSGKETFETYKEYALVTGTKKEIIEL